MNKLLAAVTLVLGLAALPSFAQFGNSMSSFEPQSVDGVHRRPHGEPPPPPPHMGPDHFRPVRVGGRIAIGGTGAGDWGGFNGDLGGSVRVYITPFLAAAPEINFAFRNLTQTRKSVMFGDGYSADYEENYNQLLLTVPLLGRFEPVPFFYAEGGLQLGVDLFSDYTYDKVYYDRYGERDYGYNMEEMEWDTAPFYATLVIGAGVNVKTNRGQDVDVGLRFALDMNAIDDTGDHAWSIQLSMTYLL